jgi:transcription antitermination factor NusG
LRLFEVMARHWYIVHTYSGFEDKVKTTLQERIRNAGQDDLFGEILVPKEQVLEMVKGTKKTSERKFPPRRSPVLSAMTGILPPFPMRTR